MLTDYKFVVQKQFYSSRLVAPTEQELSTINDGLVVVLALTTLGFSLIFSFETSFFPFDSPLRGHHFLLKSRRYPSSFCCEVVLRLPSPALFPRPFPHRVPPLSATRSDPPSMTFDALLTPTSAPIGLL